ncbi:MAG: type II toxin-antitoxin system Phd/YefM family antitoxin [Acidithiobacillus ferrivorans]
MDHASLSDFRNRIGDYLSNLGNAPVLLERYGKPAAVVLSYAEYQRLQDMEDAWWGERARAALESGLVGHDEAMGHIQEKLDASS